MQSNKQSDETKCKDDSENDKRDDCQHRVFDVLIIPDKLFKLIFFTVDASFQQFTYFSLIQTRFYKHDDKFIKFIVC